MDLLKMRSCRKVEKKEVRERGEREGNGKMMGEGIKDRKEMFWKKMVWEERA